MRCLELTRPFDHVVQDLEGLIEPLLAATVLLVVRFRGNEADQLVEIIFVAGQHDALLPRLRSEHETLAGGVDQQKAPERSGHLRWDHRSDGGGGNELGAASP